MPFAWQPGHRITATRLKAGIQAGTATVDFSTGATVITAASSGYDQDYNRKSVTVTFPAGFFSSTPFIVVSADSSVPGVLLELVYQNASSTGFTISGARFTTTATDVNWVAIEM